MNFFLLEWPNQYKRMKKIREKSQTMFLRNDFNSYAGLCDIVNYKVNLKNCALCLKKLRTTLLTEINCSLFLKKLRTKLLTEYIILKSGNNCYCM